MRTSNPSLIIPHVAILRLACLAGFIFSIGTLWAAAPDIQTLERAFTTTPIKPWRVESAESNVRKASASGSYWDLRDWTRLSVSGHLSGPHTGGVRLRWVLESRMGGAYAAAASIPVTASPVSISVDFDPAASELVPAGHTRPWDALAAAQISRIELRAECAVGPETNAYAIVLGDLDVQTRLAAAPPPAAGELLDLELSNAPPEYRAHARLTFRISPMPADPYAVDGEGDVRIVYPDGREIPAFLNQDFAARNDGSAKRASPTGRPYWCAYLPELPELPENRTGVLEIHSGNRRWRIPMALAPNLSLVIGPSTTAVSHERTTLPIEIDIPKRQEFCTSAPRAWSLDASGKWQPLNDNSADPVSAAPKLWRPVLFWNSSWGDYSGCAIPNGALAARMDAMLAAAAARGEARPLAILDGECLDLNGVFNWSGHPLNLSEALKGPGEMFRTPEGLDYAKRTMRYCIARWGMSRAVSGLLLTPALNAPGAPEFHAKVGESLKRWAAACGVAVLSLHPLACEPRQTHNLAQLFYSEPLESGKNEHYVHSFGWKPIGNATGAKVNDGGINNGKYYEVRCADPADTELGIIDTLNIGKEEFGQPAGDNFTVADTLLFEVRLPRSAPSDLRVGIHVRDRDNYWYETMLPGMLRPGDWTTYSLDITAANANQLTPTPSPFGHRKAWTEYSRQRIREIGIHVYSTHPNWAPFRSIAPLPLSAGFSGIRMVRLSPESPPPAPVISLCHPDGADIPIPSAFAGQPLHIGGLWQCHVNVSKTFANPFDARQCDLCARITTPSGRVVVVPAFFDQVCERREEKAGGPEIVEVIGGEFFTVRYRAIEAGPHQVTFELREGGEYKPTGKMIGGVYDPLQFAPGKVTATLELPQPAFVADAAALAPAPDHEGRPFHGFVRAAANKRNLQFDDGTFFYPIGADLRSPADWLFPYNDPKWTNAYADAVSARGTYQFDDYFREFEHAGMTWTRVWMCAYWCALEWRRDWPGYQGMNRYNLLNAWRLDHLLADAERRGIEISLCLTNHGQYSAQVDAEYAHNPYSSQFGGPLKSAAEFYSNRDARIGHINRLRYTVARFGHSPAIMTWSLFSEVEWTAAYKPGMKWDDTPDDPVPVIDAWHADMAHFLKTIDPNRHMVATHFSHPWRGFYTLSLPEMELASSNAYSSMMELGIGRMDASAALAAYWAGHNWFKGFKAYGKPALVEEQGRHWDGDQALKEYNVPQSLEQLDADLHAGIWGCMVQPLAGATGYWWWMHLHFDNRYSHYKAFAQYMAKEDFRPQEGEPLLEPAYRSVPSPNNTLYGRALKSDRRMYAWIYHKDTPMGGKVPVESGATLRVGGMKAGKYALEFWNTYTGEKMSSRDLEVKLIDGKSEALSIEMPPVDRDLAFKLKWTGR